MYTVSPEELLKSSVKNTLPSKPTIVAAVKENTTHTIAINLDFLILFASSIPINLTNICGCPKYPSPQARDDITVIIAICVPSSVINGFSIFTLTDSILAIVASTPPILTTAAQGTTTIATNIKIP